MNVGEKRCHGGRSLFKRTRITDMHRLRLVSGGDPGVFEPLRIFGRLFHVVIRRVMFRFLQAEKIVNEPFEVRCIAIECKTLVLVLRSLD